MATVIDAIKNYFKTHWLIFLLVLFFGILFLNLFSSHMLEKKPDGLYSGGSTWGDLAFHLTLISNFSENGFGLKNNPIFFGSRLSYSFIPDLISVFFLKLGFSLRASLIIPSFVFAILLVYFLYLLAYEITRSRFGAFLVPFMFFFNGSLLGVKYFWEDYKKSGQTFWSFFSSMQKEYAHLADFNIRFSNIVADYILPQRGVILGFLIGVLVVYFLWRYWNERWEKFLLYAGFSLSALPLVHAHSFLALLLVSLGIFIVDSVQRNFKMTQIKHWLYFVVPLAIFGIPQFALIFPWDKESFLRFHLGWMAGQDNFFVFWLKNLTPYIFLFAFGFYFAERKLKLFYLPFLAVFVITNLLLFQPHDYDNMKLMLWWFLMSLILTIPLFKFLLRKFGKKGMVVVSALLVSLTASGFLSVYRETYVSWRMFSNEDIVLAEFIKKHTPKDALFLTSDQHNLFVPTLAGRKIMMGYRGWLWTHGIDYRFREAEVLKMYEGGEVSRFLLDQYKVDYAVIDKNKVLAFHVSQSYFASNFFLIYESQNFSVYKLR